MKRYAVSINRQADVVVKASRASVAVHRAMDNFNDSMFTPVGSVTVRCLGKVPYEYIIKADVACDGGYKRETLPHYGPYKDAAEANRIARMLNAADNANKEISKVRLARAIRREVA